MVLQWKICETVFKVGLTTVFFYTVLQPLICEACNKSFCILLEFHYCMLVVQFYRGAGATGAARAAAPPPALAMQGHKEAGALYACIKVPLKE